MAPWVPTRKKDIERLLDILELKKWEKFLEIWCWDGRVSFAVAKKFPKSKIVGIELAFPMYIIAKLRNINWPKNLELKLANAFKQDFWNYDVIYVYGMPDKMGKKIIPKFLDQAKTWAKLYSYVFSIPEEYNTWVISHGEIDEAKIHVLEKK
jgi:cyclopropane fatty-acyl-phospholipid synthase-like methyltransferase